jgi:serine/threonine-protein phosphatase PGAM5
MRGPQPPFSAPKCLVRRLVRVEGVTVLHLVRHGEQDPAGEGLTPRGRQQARLAGQRLIGAALTAIHHSPVRRAAETAEVVSAQLPGVPVHVCEHLTDRTPIPAEYPAEYARFLAGVPAAERDEGPVRLRAAVERLSSLGGEHLLVTHNFVIGWFVRHALDAPDWRWIGLNQANGDLTTIRYEDGSRPQLVTFNDTGHLY